ncbi:branched-chain amino acid ABC transporter substrate-binding protein [Rubellimicrobium rubrum]|uniref:Branched-chain amino acid ABC transporter substrate-binding protein n=1 Tax=Rubellimicrobium rubrum TaxID=2585369 RepID=A0A5C4N3Z8_9RHOB|nr:ABC transporter substrate-binding protein [Rubellimicrobium rubrum]TNC52316.1 branched-chain amino acid ABC transporter substrate-binding protein [Rubellimicrobium rubrum]
MLYATAGAILLAVLACATHARAEDLPVPIVYLRQQVERPPVLSDLDPVPEDEGIAGATLGRDDNATTGRFLGQDYQLTVLDVPVGGNVLESAREALALSRLVVLDAPALDLLAVADLPEAEGALIFNVGAPDDALRDGDCRANVLHTVPSLGMRADALAQFLQLRRWTDVALLAGPYPADQAWAEALRRSAERFGLSLEDDRPWEFQGDLGRTAQAEIPLLTQDLADHDVLLVADEIGDFGRYVLFNTWEPRPVGGSEGITPVAWSPVLENWGASQLQSRFADLAGRPMRPADYAAWAAVRSIGEGVTRTGSADPADLRAYLLSPDFELDGFKGRPLSFRDWDGQLRQPIAVVQPRAMIGMAPFEPFLHQVNELDTLGRDRPESGCSAFER